MLISISYDSDLKKAKEILTKLVQAEERILSEPEPGIAILELAESSINFTLRPWVRKEDFWLVHFYLDQAAF
jgi:small conductance mechanosensitive channel